MIVSLKYGDKKVQADIPAHNLLGIIEAPVSPGSTDSNLSVSDAMINPEETRTLYEIARGKKARNAVIIVNDMTRPTPHSQILPPILHELEAAGIENQDITLVVALGIHRPHTPEENREIFGENICAHYKIENHNCDEDLVNIGRLSNGMELVINRRVAETDLLISTGVVGLHYFAGYSGGRKSVLPGVASRSLIEANHKLMNDPRACLGNYENNPVSGIMIEAARMAGVDFAVNVVLAGKNEIIYAAAGDVYHSWLKAVRVCESLNVVPIKQRADIVIASCGGYPKDINMYQAQKALDSAALAVKEGGTILLTAECREGLGEETFAEWIETASCPQDIIERFYKSFELGGHKAFAICRILQDANIYLYSSLADTLVENLYMQDVSDLQEAIADLLNKYGRDATIWIMPEAPKIAVKINA